ncbi:hypothetical protein ACPCA8_21120 [Streptomyces capoamus]|uniref:hypothetical protein n=1 Tax=Streptomyces capoamus TaxID=68183 RepID=UPI003C30A13E
MTTENTGHAPHGRRRRIARGAGGAALALAVVAGVSCTAVAVHEADHTPGVATWRLPEASPGAPDGSRSGGLHAMLLPYGDRYGRGPDLNEFGSDTELTGRQATALRKRSLANLPRSQRRALERQIDRYPVRGIALRSFISTARPPGSAQAASSGRVFTLQILLTRMADRHTARATAAYQRQLLGALDLRKGPAVEGHEDATCVLPPARPGGKLGMMLCSGYVGDVLVTANATSGRPLDQQGVARMVAAQLDRIEDPGKAV